MSVVGRLAPGMTAESAHTDMDRVAGELAAVHEGDEGWDTSITTLDEAVIQRQTVAVMTTEAAHGMISAQRVSVISSCVNRLDWAMKYDCSGSNRPSAKMPMASPRPRKR